MGARSLNPWTYRDVPAVCFNAYPITKPFCSFLPLWEGFTGSPGGFLFNGAPLPSRVCAFAGEPSLPWVEGSPAYRGWRGASSDERHVLVAWVPAEQRGLVPVGPRGARSAQGGDTGVCPDFCRRVPGVWVCVREIELDHRQRGGRSSRERVIGPGETRLLRPSSCPAGLRQNTDTCSGSSSSRCSRGGWGGPHSGVPAAARGSAGFRCLPPPPWPPGPKHAPACRSSSPKARKSATAPARHVGGRPREPRRTCTPRRGHWRWSGLGAGCPGCPGRCCSYRSCEAAPEVGCGWRCAGPGG